MTSRKATEDSILSEINANVPDGVDWRTGAVTYLKELIKNSGEHNRLYHLIKPFLGGPDFSPFFDEMYGFLNILERLDIPMKARVLDVACGPGWTSHYLAKLGYQVCGIDISDDLLEIAEERIEKEPFTVYEGVPLTAKFIIHDIESARLPVEEKFQVAIFESALHHFYNPISALRNVAHSMEEDGVICIREAVAPEPGTPHDLQNIELMEKYSTLERPYSTEQLIEILNFCGFGCFEFYTQVNGLFNLGNPSDQTNLMRQVGGIKSWNIAIASRSDNPKIMHSGTKITDASISIFGGSSSKVSSKEEAFVQWAYNRILGRNPDPTGLAHYSEQMGRGMDRREVILTLIKSAEFEDFIRSV
jgi:SAM-dependent methyltransferase